MTEWEKELIKKIEKIMKTSCDICEKISCSDCVGLLGLVKQEIKQAVSETVYCPINVNHPYNKPEILAKRGIEI